MSTARSHCKLRLCGFRLNRTISMVARGSVCLPVCPLRFLQVLCLLLSLSMTGLAGERAPAARASIAPRYVAPAGNDSAAGTVEAPWKTLQHAADRAVSGSQIHVRPGHYAGFQLTRSGSSEAPIVFLADSGAIIDTPGP